MGAVAGSAARCFLGISINPLVLVMPCYLCRHGGGVDRSSEVLSIDMPQRWLGQGYSY